MLHLLVCNNNVLPALELSCDCYFCKKISYIKCSFVVFIILYLYSVFSFCRSWANSSILFGGGGGGGGGELKRFSPVASPALHCNS